MATPRSDVFDGTEVGIYHCITQCARQMFLLRSQESEGMERWTFCEERLKFLAGFYAIDVIEYAFLTNHIHTVVRNRPEIVESWSDEEVVKRWLNLNRGRKRKNGTYKEVSKKDVKIAARNPKLVAKARVSLCCLSHFQKKFLQPIAREMNRRDKVKGHFVAGRFECKRIQGRSALLACCVYVALNPVRAGIGKNPEDHPFSSYSRRCRNEADWLAPLFLDEHSDAYQEVQKMVQDEHRGEQIVPASNEFPCKRVSEKGYLPVTLSVFKELMTWTWKNLRPKGFVDPTQPHAPPPHHLERLLAEGRVAPRLWTDTVERYEQLFYRFVGMPEDLTAAAERLNRKHVKGLRACRERLAYDPPPASTSTG